MVAKAVFCHYMVRSLWYYLYLAIKRRVWRCSSFFFFWIATIVLPVRVLTLEWQQVGLTLNQTLDHWHRDISSASASLIDGFALNIGAGDDFNLHSLKHAYKTAARFDNFSLLLSFDFHAEAWPAPDVIERR